MSPSPKLRTVSATADIPEQRWNALLAAANSQASDCAAYPFLRHEFLCAMESSGSACTETGWRPWHLVLEEQGEIIGILPQYMKSDSYGEFVFDFQWADAWQRAGGRYYPKLLTAAPFSPVPGPRILAAKAEASAALVAGQQALVNDMGLSSSHVLFADEASANSLLAAGYQERWTYQYQWFNHGYADFADFLASLTAKRRKQIKRERRRVQEAGVQIKRLAGSQLSTAEWATVYALYANTYHLRGQEAYLSNDFFPQLAASMGDSVQVFMAYHGDVPVAASITLCDEHSLYGRYWGCAEQFHSLHFELCYYSGIEYCIAQGLQRYDAGVQGEHKLSRGFEPIKARSFHWIANEQFREAIADFLTQESRYVAKHLDALNQHRPYRSIEESSEN